MDRNALQIFHVNINCSDLERSQAFYESIGFHVVNALNPGTPYLSLDGKNGCEPGFVQLSKVSPQLWQGPASIDIGATKKIVRFVLRL
jgi:catechol 2,3-dioxygenase-like lactoylglutathione lyase family enzyme